MNQHLAFIQNQNVYFILVYFMTGLYTFRRLQRVTAHKLYPL